MTQLRTPSGVPTGGQYTHNQHAEAGPMVAEDAHTISSRALADIAEQCRDAHPDAAQLLIVGKHPSFHALGVYTADGRRLSLTEEQRVSVQRSLDQVSPSVAIHDKMVVQSVHGGGGRDFLYDLDVAATA